MAKSGGTQERMAFPILIGDIGGTNARFAVVQDAASEPFVLPTVKTADFPTIDDAIAATVGGAGLRPRSAVLALPPRSAVRGAPLFGSSTCSMACTMAS